MYCFLCEHAYFDIFKRMDCMTRRDPPYCRRSIELGKVGAYYLTPSLI